MHAYRLASLAREISLAQKAHVANPTRLTGVRLHALQQQRHKLLLGQAGYAHQGQPEGTEERRTGGRAA